MHHLTVVVNGSAHNHHSHCAGAAGADHHQILKGTCLHRNDERKANPLSLIVPNNGAVTPDDGFGPIEWNCDRAVRCRTIESNHVSGLSYGRLFPQGASV